jgi:uncharacterized damage-inducible protein DinB
MTKDTVSLLAAYNQGANEQMNAVIQTLSPGDWEKPLGGFFKSVRELCSHIYVCDFMWLKRFGGLREFAALKDPLFQQNFTWEDVLFPAPEEYLRKRPELDGIISAFAGELTDRDLQSPLRYQDSGGTRYEKNFGGLLLHTFNHGTHHRGMISLYLEILGKENDFNSLSHYV